MRLKSLLIGLLGGVVGALAVLMGQGAELHMKPVEMNYNDWAGVLLAGAALVVTAVGVVMAIAAIWGFSGIKTGAETAAVKHVTDQLIDGDLGGKLEEAFVRFLNRRMKEGALRRLLEDQVNQILFSGPAMRADDSEDEDPELDAAEVADLAPEPR